MATVTRIKAQKNQKRVNIFLDGKFAFPLDADNFLKSGLKVGQKLTGKQINQLVLLNDFQKGLDKTLRFLSFRPRSEKEARDYLKKKKLPALVAEKILAKLKQRGYLDDEEFGRWWIQQRATFRPRGKYGLKMELRQKGVELELIESLLAEVVDEADLAQKAAQKKAKTLKKLSEREFRQKLTAFLSRRGFSWSVIKKTVDEISQKG